MIDFFWKACCSDCGEELAVRAKRGKKSPPATLAVGTNCDVCSHPTPITYIILIIKIRR